MADIVAAAAEGAPRAGVRGRIARFVRGRLVGTGAVSMADQAVISAGTLASSAIVGRVAGAEQLGLYTLGYTVVMFTTMLLQSFVSGPYLMFGPRIERGAPEREYAGSMLVQFAAVAVGVALVLTAAAVGASWQGHPLTPVLRVLCVGVVPVLARDYARQVAFARFEHSAALVMDAVVTALHMLGLFVLLRVGSLTATTALLSLAVACAVGAGLWMRAELGRAVVRRAIVRAEAVRSVTFGRWNFAANGASLLSLQLYPWLLTHFHGAAATAALAAGQTIVYLANPILQAIRNVLAPVASRAMARGGPAELRAVVHRTTMGMTAMMSLLCLATAAFARPLIVVVYGDRYLGSASLVPVLAANVLAGAAAIGWAYGIWSLERPDVNFRIDLISLAVTTTLGVWLAQGSGPLGAALGLLAGSVLTAGVRYVVFRRLLAGHESGVRSGLGTHAAARGGAS